MNIPNLVKQELIKIDPQAEVILFGSRARKDEHQSSDWDFLILLQRPLNKHLKDLIRDKLYDLELSTGEVISSIIHTKIDWKRRAVTPIFQIIAEEGVKA